MPVGRMGTRNFQALRGRVGGGWGSWRRYAPASLSAVFHGLCLLVVWSVAARDQPEPIPRGLTDVLSVELISEPPVASAPDLGGAAAVSVRVPFETDRARSPAGAPRTVQRSAEAPSAADVSDAGDSVFGPPSLNGPSGPAGLRSVMGHTPCADLPRQLRPTECNAELAARVGPLDSLLPRPRADLVQHFGVFMPSCPYRVGCGPAVPGTVNGSQSAGRASPGSAGDRGAGTPNAGGAAGLGGLHDSVGRLGFNPDHTDPGFGD